jgi:ATP-dependent Clp protease ATP-binding subunit ClpA
MTPEAKEFIVRVGSDEEYGARPLRRAVQQYIEDPLAELVLGGEYQPGACFEVRPSLDEKKLMFERVVPVAEGVAP